MKSKPEMKPVPFCCPCCPVTSHAGQGIAAHIRKVHPDHWKKYGMRLPETVQPEPLVTIADLIPSVSEWSARTLLHAGIKQLEGQLANVQAEIARLVVLKTQEQEIARQLEALYVANRAFTEEIEESKEPVEIKPSGKKRATGA